MENMSLTFPRQLSDSRLGEKHETLDDFHRCTSRTNVQESKEYTLVVVTETFPKAETQAPTTNDKIDKEIPQPTISSQAENTRILLGMKNRGFGCGYYNSFGGKFLNDEETAEACACRELEEETNLKVGLDEMAKSKVGIQRYTFENHPTEMVMHVFWIHLEETLAYKGGCHDVRECDEITPMWFDNINAIPFDNMFADDSLWLTTLLSSPLPIEINGSYHFQENCQDTNTILHYHMDVQKKKPKFSMEQRLFHTLHKNHSNLLSIKEFKECYAFCNGVRTTFGRNKNKKISFDIVIDVAGGHGALGALFLICTSASKAIVLDPANVGGGRIQQAWGKFMGQDKQLSYRRECLRTGLPDELKQALQMTTRYRILVVACHACQHLSEEILEIACRFGVHAAVMPCCQKDRSVGSTWKAASKNLSIPVAKMMDILQCGKMMALGSHNVRLKCIDSKITPQNRIIVCRALDENEIIESRRHSQTEVDRAHSKLELVYQKAHTVPGSVHESKKMPNFKNFAAQSPVWYMAAGFVAGFLASSVRKK
ncbi:unnamed protein product [Pseudo-nitzschia multistriata]|uniref:Nudix hydrolase domain-containing protein n=1 Tax=Pseudo-nitzschia multistriata TaxID=183589 RepID=A0A448ZJY0_9STRA|nr:unnamed protein product [Pseudo-nitzschia multistriata]